MVRRLATLRSRRRRLPCGRGARLARPLLLLLAGAFLPLLPPALPAEEPWPWSGPHDVDILATLPQGVGTGASNETTYRDGKVLPLSSTRWIALWSGRSPDPGGGEFVLHASVTTDAGATWGDAASVSPHPANGYDVLTAETSWNLVPVAVDEATALVVWGKRVPCPSYWPVQVPDWDLAPNASVTRDGGATWMPVPMPPGDASAWRESLLRFDDPPVQVVAFAGGTLLVVMDMIEHAPTDPWGGTVLLRSSDGGVSWDAPRILHDRDHDPFPDLPFEKLGAVMAEFHMLDDVATAELVLRAFGPRSPGQHPFDADFADLRLITTDGGATWTNAGLRMPPLPPGHVVARVSPSIRAPGVIRHVVVTRDTATGIASHWIVRRSADFAFADLGETPFLSDGEGTSTSLLLPAIANLGDGRAVAQWSGRRWDEDAGEWVSEQHVANSTDGGATWSEPHPLPGLTLRPRSLLGGRDGTAIVTTTYHLEGSLTQVRPRFYVVTAPAAVAPIASHGLSVR